MRLQGHHGDEVPVSHLKAVGACGFQLAGILEKIAQGIVHRVHVAVSKLFRGQWRPIQVFENAVVVGAVGRRCIEHLPRHNRRSPL